MTGFPEGSIGVLMDVIRARTKQNAFPDTCRIERPGGSPTKDDRGHVSWGSEFVLYEGSTNIPCRVEISRSFRPETTEFQELVASEFTLFLPVDVPMMPGYAITMTDLQGVVREFEPRKISNLSVWDVAQEVTVEDIMHQGLPA